MHESSYDLMDKLLTKYLRPEDRTVLDIGSYDHNGTYKPLITTRGLKYYGLDKSPGSNVDIVGDISSYDFTLEGEYSFDVIISGQTLEHINNLFIFCDNICNKILFNFFKDPNIKDTLLIFIAPHTWEEHRYPKDYWRILPDGMRYIMEDYMKCEVLAIGKNVTDTYGVGLL